jgi:hypothetical protein
MDAQDTLLWGVGVLLWSAGILLVLVSVAIAVDIVRSVRAEQRVAGTSGFWFSGSGLCAIGYLITPLEGSVWVALVPVSAEALAMASILGARLAAWASRKRE